MANQCYCGHSQMMPWCDGSHQRVGRGTQPETPGQTPPVAGTDEKKDAPAAKRRGWFARLFGRPKS